MTPILTYLLTLAALLGTGYASPVIRDEYPEVVPGPGMPSLAELGLTSWDLFEMTPIPADSGLNKRYICTTRNQPCTIAAAQTCVNYLKNLGTTNCAVGRSDTLMVSSGGCKINGISTSGGSTSSYW